MEKELDPVEMDFDLSELETLLADYPTEEAKPTETAAEETAPSPQKKPAFQLPKLPFKAPGRKPLLYVGIGAAALIVCILLGLLIGRALDPYDNRILPNTTLGGIPIGGMTRMEAYKTVKAATGSTFSQQPMTVTLPDDTLSLTPENTKAKLKVWSAVKAAYNYGRKGTEEQKQAAVEASALGGSTIDMLPYLKIDQEYIRSQLEAYADQFNVSHTEFSYKLTGEQPKLQEDLYDPDAPVQTLELTLGTPKEELDVDAVLAQILNAYSFNTLSLTIDSIPYQTTPEDPDLAALNEEFYIEPVNTTLDMNTYHQVPGSYGYSIDLEAAETLLSQAEYGDTVSIPMAYVKPEILGDEAYFRDELGYCETKHTNNENRNTNLRLACAALDGLILQPGEEFSFNGTVGQRTKEKGYKPAAAYSGYNTVDAIGGGVCQVSTTIYNSALLADMEIIFRINHGYRSGYIGIGLDATVSWPNPDFQFKNSFHFPVMVKAEVSDGYVKIKLLGTDEKDYYVKMTSGYSDDDTHYYAWSYKSKYSKETDELISKEKEAYSSYMK